MLVAENIHKYYHNGKKDFQVLNGVSLNVEEGKFLAITGPSGAGKSTLLHILGGLDYPTSGRVIFGGRDIYRLPDPEIARIRNEAIGFVFQFYHLLPEFTVLENALMPAMINVTFRSRGTEIKKRAVELLDKVGLGEKTVSFPSQLSGGEKQRLAIVRGLMNEPSILLCDEPTGNLDSKTGEGIISLLRKINQERKMSVVLVTHNLELTKAADKIYHLKDGLLVN